MHLVSLAAQTVRVLHRDFSFAEGERIHTENSHKYSVAQFQALAEAGGLAPGRGVDRRGSALQPASVALGLTDGRNRLK